MPLTTSPVLYVDTCNRDPFHDSPSDAVTHAGIVYEDKEGNHLSEKHVAKNPEDQAKVDKVIHPIINTHFCLSRLTSTGTERRKNWQIEGSRCCG